MNRKYSQADNRLYKRITFSAERHLRLYCQLHISMLFVYLKILIQNSIMTWIIVVFLAVTTFSPLDCKSTEKGNLKMFTDNVISPQNRTGALRKNDEAMAKSDRSVTIRKLNTRLRAVSDDVPSMSTSTLLGDMNAEQSYHQSPLMMYPFPMTNSYYPRYFPYNYPGHNSGYYPGYYPGYRAYPYVG